MAIQKPSVPKGTRDFSPAEMVRRNYIFDTIRAVYKKYGYLPIETPAMEKTSTLMGKYGEEGDRLIFRVLNSANYFSDFKDDVDIINTKNAGFGAFTNKISEKALRYDLTVPFARYVVQHQNDITFPFKRYQIQPVWRADNPQFGRYREFYQCDADVIGSNSLLNEIELVQIIDEVFSALKIPVTIKINNRKVLTGIIEELEIDESHLVDVITAIDKLEKVGVEGVKEELLSKGLKEQTIEELIVFISEKLAENFSPFIPALSNIGHSGYATFKKSEIGRKGINELRDVCSKFMRLGSTWYGDNDESEEGKGIIKLNEKNKLEIDFSLARGLNYYTGAIFEVKANEGKLKSSICGGGRYDDLTGIFGLPGLSGVGISFGADRIYDVLLDLNLYPEEVAASTKLLFVGFDENDLLYCLPLLKQVRDAGISAELYPDARKMPKQMAYANAKSIPFVAIVGENERKENVVMLKNMKTGTQEKITVDALIAQLHQ